MAEASTRLPQTASLNQDPERVGVDMLALTMPPIRSGTVSIERFIWTTHALVRLDERRLRRTDVERAIRGGHRGRKANEGEADWLIEGLTAYGVRFEAVYDHPAGDDETTARIVSAWRVG